MRRLNRLIHNEDGSAPLEFLLGGLLLLVPIAYLVLTLGVVHGKSLGVDAAAREISRAIAASPNAEVAAARADAAAASIAREYDIDPGSLRVSLSCTPRGVECPSAGVTLTVAVSAAIPLPLMPGAFGIAEATSAQLSATSVHSVSRVFGEVDP